jgi:single-strand DNA-binding protein
LVNKVILVGNLGRDAELRYTPNGSPVSSFSIACTEKYKDKSGQRQEKTEWVRCVMWGKRAEALSEYLMKGKQLYVEGRLQTRKWQGRDGKDNYSTEVVVTEIQLLGGGKGNGQRQQPARAQQPAASAKDPFDTPFEDDGGGAYDEAVAAGGGDLTDDDIPF